MSSASTDPTRLLRQPDAVDPYPVEPSDDELAEQAGIPRTSVLRFDLNTLAGGALPAAVAGLRSYEPDRLPEYGDQGLRELRGAIASVIGVTPERVVPGAGADELIRLLTTAVVGPGDAVVIATPTFAMYDVEARLAGGRVVAVERMQPDQRQRAADLRRAATEWAARLVWICSPNNPTADAFSVDEIRGLAEGLDAVVAVDCVYQEFAEASAGVEPEAFSLAALQDELPNLVILRSLAKAYGLAGARVGYLVAHPALADRLSAARLPLPIGGPSEAAAIGALSDPAAARARHHGVIRERERLAGALAERGWRVLPSVTNFLLARPPDGLPAPHLAVRLLAAGIAVRSYPGGLLATWLRITVRTGADDARLLAAMDEISAATA
jgi:histidinol-phosphate aminotransferase